MRLNDPQAAQYALLVMSAEDMYQALPPNGKGNLTPPIDPRILAAGWGVVGFIRGDDALLDTQNLGLGQTLFYGFLARSNADPTQYVAVVRGTDNEMEWLEDIEFFPIPAPAPAPGSVENGFYSIYYSMTYAPIAGGASQPVAPGIAAAVGPNKVTVVGHSLGSAIGTFLALDLAVQCGLKVRASACLIASPRPGDINFAQYFDRNVLSYQVYNYSLDLIPKLPPGIITLSLGYVPLPKALEFQPQDAQARIRNSPTGNHHAVCYAAMLDYTAATWTAMPPSDQDCAVCISGPNP